MVRRELEEETETRARCCLQSVCPPSSPITREVRGLVVMTAVVMGAELGNKQDEGMPSIQCSEAAVATVDKMCCCHGTLILI